MEKFRLPRGKVMIIGNNNNRQSIISADTYKQIHRQITFQEILQGRAETQ